MSQMKINNCNGNIFIKTSQDKNKPQVLMTRSLHGISSKSLMNAVLVYNDDEIPKWDLSQISHSFCTLTGFCPIYVWLDLTVYSTDRSIYYIHLTWFYSVLNWPVHKLYSSDLILQCTQLTGPYTIIIWLDFTVYSWNIDYWLSSAKL